MRESTKITQGERGDDPFCQECLVYGADSLMLRVCLTCGHVGCAEGSHSDHAAEHYSESDHPIAAAISSTLQSRWSYPDERLV